jgi:hypothetical protein
MANTVIKAGQITTVVFDGITEFDLAREIGAASTGVRLKKLVFYPNAPGDEFTVRDGGAGGPVIAKMQDSVGDGRDLDYHGVWCFPFVVGNEVAAGSLISFIYA